MEGKSLWIQVGDVDGRIEPGNVVTAARELNDWCLRGDDGSKPVPAGTLLEVVEKKPWGAAMAREMPDEQPLDPAPAAEAGAGMPLMMYRGRVDGVHVLSWRRGCAVARVWREGSRWLLQTHDVERGTVETTIIGPWCVARSEARFAVGARPVRVVREAMAQMRRGGLLLKPATAGAVA